MILNSSFIVDLEYFEPSNYFINMKRIFKRNFYLIDAFQKTMKKILIAQGIKL
jgi:hypothetical protein